MFERSVHRLRGERFRRAGNLDGVADRFEDKMIHGPVHATMQNPCSISLQTIFFFSKQKS